jgi:tetratricopeptide (TPR) repeat protein
VAVGRLQEALELLEAALPVMTDKRGPDHTDTISCMMSLATTYAALKRHDDALKLRVKTVELREAKFGRDNLETLKAKTNLAASYAALDRHEEALKLHMEILEIRKVKLGPDNTFTLRSMHSVASSLIKLNRGAEAIPIIDECVRLAAGKDVDRRLIPWDMDYRLRHFETAKDAAGCRATAEMWEKLNRSDVTSLYTAAVMRAVTAAVIKQDPKIPAANAVRLADDQADAAMAWLKKAVAAGYKDLDQIRKDKDLDPLRGRDDFKKLQGELEADPRD